MYGCPQGQAFTSNTSWPYAEMISFASYNDPYPAWIYLNGPTFEWTTIQGPCLIPGTNIRSLNPFNLLARAQLKIVESTAAPGARYEVRFRLVDAGNVEYDAGQYVRVIRADPVAPSQPLLPQGDTYNGSVQNLPAGNYKLLVQARLLDAGSIRFNLQFASGQAAPTSIGGVPTGYASAKNVIAEGVNVSGWQAINEITFSTTKMLHIMPQGYVQVDLGTAGETISVSLALDGQSVVSDFSLAGGSREGFNLFGHFFNVPAGSHTLQLWATNRNGTPTAMRWRQLEFLSFPANGSGADMSKADYGTTTVVSTDAPSSDQPVASIFLGGSDKGWTKIAEFTMPFSTAAENWMGDAYVEFVGRGIDVAGTEAGDWSDPKIQIGVEAITGPHSTDFSIISLAVPTGPAGISLFPEAMLWGNTPGNTIKLWIRKIGSTPSVPTKFRIRKRWIATAVVPFSEPAENGCWEYNPSQTAIFADGFEQMQTLPGRWTGKLP